LWLWNMFLFRVVFWNHVGFCRAQLIMATLAKISGWAGNSSPSLSLLSFSLSLVLSIYSPPPVSPQLCIAHNIRWGTMSRNAIFSHNTFNALNVILVTFTTPR
jgi:hypothetical protein